MENSPLNLWELGWDTYLMVDQVIIYSSSHMFCGPKLCYSIDIHYSLALGFIYQLLF